MTLALRKTEWAASVGRSQPSRVVTGASHRTGARRQPEIGRSQELQQRAAACRDLSRGAGSAEVRLLLLRMADEFEGRAKLLAGSAAEIIYSTEFPATNPDLY
jgi:hypothetical protein